MSFFKQFSERAAGALRKTASGKTKAAPAPTDAPPAPADTARSYQIAIRQADGQIKFVPATRAEYQAYLAAANARTWRRIA